MPKEPRIPPTITSSGANVAPPWVPWREQLPGNTGDQGSGPNTAATSQLLPQLPFTSLDLSSLLGRGRKLDDYFHMCLQGVCYYDGGDLTAIVQSGYREDKHLNHHNGMHLLVGSTHRSAESAWSAPTEIPFHEDSTTLTTSLLLGVGAWVQSTSPLPDSL